MSKIKCEVKDCAYNNQERCEASQIEVRTCGCSSTGATCADETACETFVQRNGCHC